jgi:hypothetical protein
MGNVEGEEGGTGGLRIFQLTSGKAKRRRAKKGINYFSALIPSNSMELMHEKFDWR